MSDMNDDDKEDDEQQHENDDEEDMEPAFIDEANVAERIILDAGKAPPDDLDEDDDGGEAQDGGEGEDEDAEVRSDAVCSFHGHNDAVYCVAVAPFEEGREILVVSGDGADGAELGLVWSLKTGALVHTLKGHTDSVTSCHFSCDGKLVATGSMDGSIRVYDAVDGKLKQSLEGPSAEIEWFQWHPKGPVIVAGSADSTVWMWNAATGACMRVFSGHKGSVLCGAFTNNGMAICTGCEDGSLFIWSPKTGTATHQLIKTKSFDFHEAPVTSIATHPTDTLVMTGSEDGSLRVTNYVTGKVLTKLGDHKDSVESVGFCSTLKLAVSASIDGTIKIWDLTNGQLRAELAHSDAVVSVRWHPTKPLVYSISADRSLRLWDGRSGTLKRTWVGHRAPILAFDLTSDGESVVTCSDDATCLVFSAEEAQLSADDRAREID